MAKQKSSSEEPIVFDTRRGVTVQITTQPRKNHHDDYLHFIEAREKKPDHQQEGPFHPIVSRTAISTNCTAEQCRDELKKIFKRRAAREAKAGRAYQHRGCQAYECSLYR